MFKLDYVIFVFGIIQKSNQKDKSKRFPRALPFFKVRNRKRTKALSGSTKKRKFTAYRHRVLTIPRATSIHALITV
jgi:hypothetical protein